MLPKNLSFMIEEHPSMHFDFIWPEGYCNVAHGAGARSRVVRLAASILFVALLPSCHRSTSTPSAGSTSGTPGVSSAEMTGLFAQKNIERLTYSPDGKFLAVVVFDRVTRGANPKLQIWGLAKNQLVVTFPGHKSLISQIAFSPDGKLLASSCGEEFEVKLWDCTTGKLRHEIREQEGNPRLGEKLLAFSSDGKSLLTIMQGLVVRIDVETGKTERQVFFMNFTTVAALSPVAPKVAIAQVVSANPPRAELHFYDYATQEDENLLSLPNTPTAIAFSRDGGTVAVATRDGGVQIVDVRTRKLRATLPKPATPEFLCYQKIELNTDGSRLCCVPMASRRPQAEIWDVASLQNRPLPVGWCADVTFSPDGKTVAVAVTEERVKFVDPATGQDRTP
jgi:WD40 repeat protein